MSPPRVRVSGHVYFLFRDGRPVCDIPRHRRQIALRPAAWQLLPRLGGWTDPGTLSDPERRLATQLLDAKVLIEEDSAAQKEEDRATVWRRWGAAATHYHLAARTDAATEYLTGAQDTERLRAHAGARPEPFRKTKGELVRLPEPLPLNDRLDEVLQNRRSIRHLDPAAHLPLREFATVLAWTARPLHQVDLGEFGTALLKASPSAGACHPIDVHPLVTKVENLAPGLYRYAPGEHALEPLPAKAPNETDLQAWCGGQPHAVTAGTLLLYTAVLNRSAWKYPTGRAYTSLFVDLGHLSQTAYLVATALGLGAFFTAATRDAPIEAALGIDWTEEVFLGLTGLGTPAEQAGTGLSFPMDSWDGLG
jgi:SagB-type dehydrogenase family enzyme